MPTTVFNDATVELLNYQQFLDYAADSLNYAGQTEMLNHIAQQLRSNPFNSSSSLTTREQWAQQIMNELERNGYRIEYNGNNQWTGTVFPNTAQVSTLNPVNSNITEVSRGSVRSWYGGLNEFNSSGLQTWVPQRMPVSGGLGSKAMYFLGSIGSSVAAASTGIWLGKTFDSALYNAFPDFWDSIGWNSLNPETWGSLTEGSDSPFAGLLNFILGIDGEHGNAQTYISEDMLAYLAYGLYTSGMFTDSYQYDDSTVVSGYNLTISPNVYGTAGFSAIENGNPYSATVYGQGTAPVVAYYESTASNRCTIWVVSLNPFNYHKIVNGVETVQYINSGNSYGSLFVYRESYTVYYSSYDSGSINLLGTISANYRDYKDYVNPSVSTVGNAQVLFQYLVAYGTTAGQPIAGIGNQESATLPDTTGWDDLANVLPSLQQQYPDAFQNPMIWNTDTPYDDTTGNQTRYIPVPFPFANSATDNQPISGPQTQSNISLNTTPQDIIKLLTNTIQQTDTEPATPPSNPNDTGTGNTPVPMVPIGNSSALWSVYHPTQAQVNSFGSWLWSGNIITQIQQLLNNPMDGIITLHKIFITPVDSGNGTIVVGRLDSEVPSATVNQQYVYADCGTVNCYEEFGNVFDYEPYTKVSLYLPFIGIVPLNTNEVMRSHINIKYGVDVFTGACLAMVAIIRDGNTVNMYQYSGMASVEYPLTGAIHNGLINGILGVAGGIAGIAAASTGVGMVAGVGALAAGASNISQSSNAHAGSFSGNSGAMGIKKPYIIIERPQTKVANDFILLDGYPTNYSVTLNNCSGHVVCSTVHVNGINATEFELNQIESILKDGVEL